MFYRIWSLIHQDLSCFYQINLISFSCLHLCLTVLCTTPGLNVELLVKSTLLTLVWVQLPIWKCAISCHLICLLFDSSVISSHVLLFYRFGHMLMFVSPMLNITFITTFCERTYQTPSHFKACKACTAESQPFPQAYVCLAITFLQKIKNIKKIKK